MAPTLTEGPAGHWTLRHSLFFFSARFHGSREPGGARGAGQKGFFQVHHSWVPPAGCRWAPGVVAPRSSTAILGGLPQPPCKEQSQAPRDFQALEPFSPGPLGQVCFRKLVLGSFPWSLSTGQPLRVRARQGAAVAVAAAA